MTTAALVTLAAPLALLPAAYLLWWFDRHRLSPLPRYLATFALAVAVGLLVAAYWPPPAPAPWRVLGPEMSGAADIAGRLPMQAGEAARLALAELAVLLFMLMRGELETPLDGVIFGVAAGVGFALPAGWVLAESAVTGTWELAAAVAAPLGMAAVLGLALACSRLDLRFLPRLGFVIAGTAVAVAIATIATAAAVAADRPWPIALGAVAGLAGAAAVAVVIEVRVGRRELAEEAALGVLPVWASEVGPRLWRRVRAAWWPRRDERRAVGRLLVDLAFRKQQLRHLGDERATLYSLEVGRLRERARRLLDPGGAAPGTPEERG